MDTYIKLLVFGLILAWFELNCCNGLCGYPGSPAYGKPNPEQEEYEEGAAVMYTCPTGYILLGSIFRKCMENGTWSGEIPLCDDSVRSVGKASSTDTFPFQPASMALDGDKSTCAGMKEKKPRWWRMDMGKNQHVMSVIVTVMDTEESMEFKVSVVSVEGVETNYQRCASFSGRFGSKTVVLTCAEGKGLVGQFVHIEDVDNSGSFELCEVEVQVLRDSYDCGQPDQKLNSYVNRPDRKHVYYHCNSGYELDGPGMRHCLASGQWSNEPPGCKPIICDGLMPLNHGSMQLSIINGGQLPLEGTTAVYSCDEGFTLIGDETRVCTDDGGWSGKKPICKAIDCGKPDTSKVQGIYKLLNTSTKYGAVAKLRCRKNQMAGDDPYIRCTIEGTWTESQAYCLVGASFVAEEPRIKGKGAITFGMVAAVFMMIVVVGSLVYIRRQKLPPFRVPQPPPPPLPPHCIIDMVDVPPVDRSIPKPKKYTNDLTTVPEESTPVNSRASALRNKGSSEPSLTKLKKQAMKGQSLPNQKTGVASKENVYEEIEPYPRRVQSYTDAIGGKSADGSSKQPLYSSVDYDKKKQSRQLKGQGSVESESPEPATQTDEERSETEHSDSSRPPTRTDSAPLHMRTFSSNEKVNKESEEEEEESEEDEPVTKKEPTPEPTGTRSKSRLSKQSSQENKTPEPPPETTGRRSRTQGKVDSSKEEEKKKAEEEQKRQEEEEKKKKEDEEERKKKEEEEEKKKKEEEERKQKEEEDSSRPYRRTRGLADDYPSVRRSRFR